VGRRKRRSAPSPAKKGWRPERWQTFLAAVVAAIATLSVALITTFGGSSSGGSPSDVSVSNGKAVAAVPASAGSAVAVAPAAAQSSQLTISITSFTSVSWPPPPGENYSFRGFISNLSALGGAALSTGGPGTYFEVYVVECAPVGNESDTNGSNCLQSPAGHLSENGAWYVNNWHIRDPFINAKWAAMITEGSTGNVVGCFPSPPSPPASTPPNYEAFAYNLVKQAQCSFGIDAFSKPVSSR
jgi:hypothetical protein